MLRLLRLILAVSVSSAVLSTGAEAAEHVVKMLNKSGTKFMQFEPAFVKAAPGDTVKFVPTDKSHSAESIPGMWPEGADKFKGGINQEISVKLDKEGVYGVKCLPHYAMGMVALIQVGNPTNLDAAKAFKAPAGAAKHFEELFPQVTQ